MKIGILTYTREYSNLGTIMQCYSTMRAVQKANPEADVELIDYALSRPRRKPYLSSISVQSLKNDFARMRKYDRFFERHFRFSKEALCTPDTSRAFGFFRGQGYDSIYVGSDTILELKGAAFDTLNPFWLDDRVPGLKVLAAASSHSVNFEQLSPVQRDLMLRSIDSFALLGVRDDATYQLVARHTGASDPRLQMVPDPTFTHAIDHAHMERYFAARPGLESKPMVCLHLLRNSSWGCALADRFRKAGYVVASLRPARYADVVFTDLGPFEQLGLYRHFSLVVTHRFHDAVFSLKNLTPVMAFPERPSDVTSAGESKLRTLLRTFGSEHLCYVTARPNEAAEAIFDGHVEVVRHFASHRSEIEATLSAQRTGYEAFMQRATLMTAAGTLN